MKKVLLAFMALLITTSIAIAGGDKIRDANPIKGDACYYSIPAGIDPDTCRETVATSSQVAYLTCTPEVIVWCVGEDNPSSDGNSNPND